MSPKKEIKPESGLLGNLSKFIISSDNLANTSQNEPQLSNVFDKLSDSNNQTDSGGAASWGGWKPWGGVVSLLSTASDGVASITSHVSSVIESGIGVPDPSEMARAQREDQRKKLEASADGTVASEEVNAESQSKKPEIMMLGQFVSGVTQISNRVITGGLDTLEGIGKKTMNILQENDPGLLKKRKMLMMDNDAPILSQVSAFVFLYVY